MKDLKEANLISALEGGTCKPNFDTANRLATFLRDLRKLSKKPLKSKLIKLVNSNF